MAATTPTVTRASPTHDMSPEQVSPQPHPSPRVAVSGSLDPPACSSTVRVCTWLTRHAARMQAAAARHPRSAARSAAALPAARRS
eukprot:653421-Prymnesium_polylepis.2